MVVDDNLATLKQISSYLSGLYDYSLKTSGLQAESGCREEAPDLVLLDADMPVMDGYETIKRLKSLPAMGGVPVIFMSADNSKQTELKALESGARDFIIKPVDSSILLHRIALHLELAEYENNMETTRRDLENNIVLSFAELVESKDSNTGGHVLRTSRYLEYIGRELLSDGRFKDQLSPDSLDMMVKAAPFHDIGKIGISDVLLLKPGPLTESEYGEVKKHSIVGANFLRNIYKRLPEQKYLEMAAVMAEGHHERFDGKGYPYGLKGTDIPFSCRLLTVANVYDACLTERIYRPALNHDEASQVVIDGKGTMFDPDIVDAFLRVSAIFRALNQPQTNLPRASKRSFTAGFRIHEMIIKSESSLSH
jgi:putative two-component system response regulator